MPTTKPLTITQVASDDKLQRATSKCLVNYGFFMGTTAEPLPDLLLAHPTPGIKIFMGSMHRSVLVDQESALERIFAAGSLLIAVHAEDQARIRRENAQSPRFLSNWMVIALAQAYGIPTQGAIAAGHDTDLVLVNVETYRPVLREELWTKCGWSPFEGWNLTGFPVMTRVGGQIVYEQGALHPEVRGRALMFENSDVIA